MLNSAQILHNRPLGQFPISIATSLAFERLKGIHPDFPLKKGEVPNYLNYDYVHINARTLIRNCYTSLKAEEAALVNAKDMCEIIAEEMGIIQTILNEQMGERFLVSFYFVSYENLKRQFPDANLKQANTQKQKHYADIEDKTIELLLNHRVLEDIVYEKTDLKTRLGNKKALMLTHFPVDVLVARYKRFSLFESHTGTVRSQEFMTNKLKTVKVKTIPFDIMTLQFFGDTGNMFVPQSIKYRRALERIANKYNWNRTTTRSKITENIKMANEPHLYDYVMKLYKAPRG